MLRYCLIIGLVPCFLACGVSPKTQLYVLNSEAAVFNNTDGISIGLWKVKLPELLDRSEIVTRNGQYEVELADFHHWAGSLGHNIDASIAQGLSQHLKTINVRISPWHSEKQNNYQVKVLIERFGGSLMGAARISGRWVLMNGKGNQQLSRQSFLLEAPMSSENYNGLVASLSILTGQLSQLIAEDIERLSQR